MAAAPVGFRPRARALFSTQPWVTSMAECSDVGSELDRLECAPFAGKQELQRAKLRLVVHLVRIRDPIAQIEMPKTRRARLLDMIEDRVDAERASALLGIEKRINHRQAVAEHVDERGGREVALLFAV